MLKKVLNCTTALGLFMGIGGFASATTEDAPKEPAANQKKIDEFKSALDSLKIDLKTIKGDTVVAKIGKKSITADEVAAAMQTTLRAASQNMGPEFVKTLTPEILFLIAREQLVDLYIINQEVEANKKRLEADQEVQEAIAEATKSVLQQAFLNEKSEEYVTKDKIKAKYEEVFKEFPKDAEEVRLRMIVVKNEDEAKKLIDQLDKGGDFLKLARENSIDKKSAAQDGDLGYVNEMVAKSTLLPGFEVIFEKKDGKPVIATGGITKTPIKSPMGYHVLKIEDRRPVKKPKLSEAEPLLKEALRQEAVQKMQENLKKKAGTIEYLHPNTGKPMQSLESELKEIQAKLTGGDKGAAPEEKPKS